MIRDKRGLLLCGLLGHVLLTSPGGVDGQEFGRDPAATALRVRILTVDSVLVWGRLEQMGPDSVSLSSTTPDTATAISHDEILRIWWRRGNRRKHGAILGGGIGLAVGWLSARSRPSLESPGMEYFVVPVFVGAGYGLGAIVGSFVNDWVLMPAMQSRHGVGYRDEAIRAN